MTSIEQLLYELTKVKKDDIADYLNDFFLPEKRGQYLNDERFDDEDFLALEIMFEKEDVLVKAYKAFKRNPFCMEAFIVIYELEEDIKLYSLFKEFNKENIFFANLSPYHKHVYCLIETYYADFLINIRNLTSAKNIILNLMSKDNEDYDAHIYRLSYIYSCLEDLNSFYELYLNNDFNDLLSYLLLLVVCLKHNDNQKAKEVYDEFLSKFKYADYIDHIWDLDEENDDDAMELKMTLNACYNEISSIPYFFSWCNENKEKLKES